MIEDSSRWHELALAESELMLLGISNKREDLVNMLGFHAYIKEDARLDLLEKAWNMILEYHDALRYRIKGQVVKKQRVVPYEYETLPVVKVDGFEGLMELEKKEREKPVLISSGGPLYRVVLVDCGNGTGGMIACIHNIVVDGYSLGLIFDEMEAYYNGALKGETVVPKAKKKYIDYINYEQKYLKSQTFKEDVKWWREKYRSLKDYCIPAGRPSFSVETGLETVYIKDDLYQRFISLCSEESVSVSSVVMSLMAITTYRVTGKKCFCFYNLTHGRWTYGLKQTVGCISGCNPVFFQMDLGKTFREIIRDDYKEYLQYMKHGRVPIYRHVLLAYFDSLKQGFNFRHNWMFFSPMELAGISAESGLGFECFDESELENQFYSAVYDMPQENMMQIDLNYQKARYSDAKIQFIIDGFIETLNCCIDHPDDLLNELRVVKENGIIQKKAKRIR